jgi:Bys1 family protein
MRSIAAFAAFAASVSTVSAQGQAYIKNYCSFPVSLWAVDAQRNPTAPTTLAPGADYTEPYHTPTVGGVSLKLSTGDSLYTGNPITQFEYTLLGGFIWYDGSNVNCNVNDCPFYPYGVFLQTTDSSCPSRVCQPSQKCDGFYNNYNDDWNSLSCQPGASIQMYLCATSASGPAAAPAAPAPASATSAAPSIPAPVANAVEVSSAAPSPTTSEHPLYRMEVSE